MYHIVLSLNIKLVKVIVTEETSTVELSTLSMGHGEIFISLL